MPGSHSSLGKQLVAEMVVVLCDVTVGIVLINVIEKPLSNICMIQSKLTYGTCVADLSVNTMETTFIFRNNVGLSCHVYRLPYARLDYFFVYFIALVWPKEDA